MDRWLLVLVLICLSITATIGGTQRPFIADAYTGALWHMDEATVSRVYDSGGKMNTGTEFGTSIVDGKFGNARHFNGTSAFINVLDPSDGSLDFDAAQSFTVEACFRTTSSATQTIVRKGLAPVPGFLLQMIGGKVVGNVGSHNENIYAFQSVSRYDDGEWHHAAVVVDRRLKNISLYVDGELATSPVNDSSPFSVANDRPLTIGRWENNSYPTFFAGDIDEVRVSPIVRYAVTDTVACWSMDEVSGAAVADASPWHMEGTAWGTTIVPGVSGNARLFDGASSVFIPDPGNGILGFSATESFTIAISFKTTYVNDQSIIRRGLAPVPGYLIQMLSGKVVGNVGSYDTKIHAIVSTHSYNDGQWHRAVLITDRNEGQIFLYIDGVLAATPVNDDEPFAVYNDRPFTFGRWENADWPYFYHGAIDDVIILRGAHHPDAVTSPRLSLSRDSLAFGLVDIGKTVSLPLAIRNASSQDQLNIEMETTESHFGISASYLEIAPGESKVLAVTYSPTSAQSDTGSLILASNDLSQPIVRVPLKGSGGALPSWAYITTGTTHTIIIPMSANTGVNGVQLVQGDYIGVFYDSLGTPTCAGFERWTDSDNIAVTAFGDDATTAAKDGFAVAEVFQWKIFRASTEMVEHVDVTYFSPGGIVTHTNAFATNGISRLASFTEGNVSHCLSLRTGWSLISSTVAPYVTSLDTIFRPVLQNLVILRNGNQNSYIPSVPVNTIGLWDYTQGYQVKLTAAGTLCVRGRKIVPTAEPLVIPVGWSFIPYLRDSAMSVTALLGSISSHVVVVKDQDGKTYIPSAGINTIGSLTAGQAYQIKVTDSCTVEYPALAGQQITTDGRTNLRTWTGKNGTDTPSWYHANTGESHTVIIPLSSNPNINGTTLTAGDFIGVFYDSLGTIACAGFEMWSGTSNLAVAAFGDDPTTPVKDGLAAGESMRWKIWHHSDGLTYDGNAHYQIPGSLGGVVTDTCMYHANGISALASLVGTVTGVPTEGRTTSFSLRQNYPNPFNPSTIISYVVGAVSGQNSETRNVKLAVYDMLGREVAVLVDGIKAPGSYTVQFDAAGLASGIYMYRFTAGDFVAVKRLTLLR